MQTTLIKLGGSIITRKRESEPCLDRQNVSRIAEEIAAFLGKGSSALVIVHGAGSYGHPIAGKYNLADGLNGNIVPLAQCQALMNQLNAIICLELAAKNVPAYPFQLSAGSMSSNKKISDFNVGLMEKLLALNVVPVIFGTPAYDEKQECSIISGDQIISRLSSELKASRVVFATDVDGIFDKNPDVHNDARLIRSLDSDGLKKVEADASSAADVTGGMDGKIKWIRAMKDLTCHVINGNVPEALAGALSGDDRTGTVIKL